MGDFLFYYAMYWLYWIFHNWKMFFLLDTGSLHKQKYDFGINTESFLCYQLADMCMNNEISYLSCLVWEPDSADNEAGFIGFTLHFTERPLTGKRSEKSLSILAAFPFLLSWGASSSSSITSSWSSVTACSSVPAAAGAFLWRSSSACLSSGIRVPASMSRHCDKLAKTALRVWAWRAAGRVPFMFHSVPEERGTQQALYQWKTSAQRGLLLVSF